MDTLDVTFLHTHPAQPIGRVDPRIFGGFIEHMGRCVYEGIFDPKSAHADAFGIRQDVAGALSQLRMTAMRYPGGNFASGYHWRDGIGPADRRPVRTEYAWHSLETNQFGTHEFLRLSEVMGWTPMVTFNLGTGTPQEAIEWVEYISRPAGTAITDERVANGRTEPWDVRLWCLGNEMDGPWQIGHVPARDYGLKAQVTAKLVKELNPQHEVVVSGSSGIGMDTYASWDLEALNLVGDLADFVSLHHYVGNRDGDSQSYLHVARSIDQQIEQTDAVCRTSAAMRKSKRRAFLCFDEWNVWYKNMHMDGDWKPAPHLIEEVYNHEDALVVAGILLSFLRHADVVHVANIAQVVNIIAPLLTDGDRMLVQTIFHPFRMISDRRDGTSLRVGQVGPTVPTTAYGDVPALDSAVILDEAGGRAHAFLINRSTTAEAPVQWDAAGVGIAGLESAEIVHHADLKAVNEWDQPNQVAARPFDGLEVGETGVTLTLPPQSFVALTVRLG